MKPGTIMWLLAATEWLRFVWAIRRYGNVLEEDPTIMSRMPLAVLVTVRSRMIGAFFLTMTAQIMWWLP